MTKNDALFSTIRNAVKSGALRGDMPYLDVIAEIESGNCDDVAGAIYWLKTVAKGLNLPDRTAESERRAEFLAENAVTGFHS